MKKSMNKGLIDHFLPGEIMRFRNLSQYYSSPLAIGIAIAASILYWSYEDRLNEEGWMRRMTIRDKWCCLSPSRSRYFHWMASPIWSLLSSETSGRTVLKSSLAKGLPLELVPEGLLGTDCLIFLCFFSFCVPWSEGQIQDKKRLIWK